MAIGLRRFREVGAFALVAEAFLVRREAENNLLMGIISGLREGPRTVAADAAYLGVGFDDVAPAGVVIWTKGWRPVLSLPDHEAFGAAAGVALKTSGLPITGVLGPPIAAAAFAHSWQGAGVAVREADREPIYRLSRKPAAPAPPGRLRRAEEGDLETLTDWWRGFARDAMHRQVSVEDAGAIARNRIGVTHLWEVGEPRSMAVAAGPTPHGIRIAGVYTPPELRGRGYASACVTALSRKVMDEGRQFCFLFTDAANPTSNAIYRRIGYEQVAEMVALDFAR